MSESGLRRIQGLKRLQRGLAEVMKAEFIPQWLETPKEEFGGCKPLQLLERGELDRIWSLSYDLKSGMPI